MGQSDGNKGVRRVGTLQPPWRLAVFALAGALIGVSAWVSRISNAPSYLTDNPEACINCHIMVPQYATWSRSGHRSVATCNDCHVPHDNVVAEYAFKAKDGGRHAVMFTLRMEPQVIRISEGAVPVVQANCLRCHERAMEQVRLAGTSERTCWDCHDAVPHGTVRSLSATPDFRRPPLPSAGVPDGPGDEKGE